MVGSGAPMAAVYLIDGSGYIYRAFHAIPGLSNSRGLPTNAIYGFTTMLAKLLRVERPRRIAVVFDAPGATFRDALFADYKAHRPAMPAELVPQLPYVRRVVEALRLPLVEVPGVEADDVIGTLAARTRAQGGEVVIVTADKDMMQLVDERTTLLDTMRDRRTGPDEVRARFGVEPRQVPDVLGLMGDATDNIPGVTGIGEKTAVTLVQKFGSIEELLAEPARVAASGVRGGQKIADTLRREAEQARLSRHLATIRCDVPVDGLPEADWTGPDPDALRPLLQELEFSSLLRELAPTSAAPVAIEYRCLASAADVVEQLASLTRAGHVALAADAGLATLAVAPPTGVPFSVDGGAAAGALEAMAPLLGDLAVTKTGGDLKSLRVALARRGVRLDGPIFDVSLASYCINPSQPDHSPAALSADLLGAPLEGTPGSAPFLCGAARAAHALRPLLEERVRERGMHALLHDVELPLAAVLADMELAGIGVDTARLAALSVEFGAGMERLLGEIHALAGGPFNVSSPPQLRVVLFERLGLSTKGVKRGKTGLSTDVDVLTRLAEEHPLPAKILEYRQLAKLKSTYVDALASLVDPETGRVHTSFNQTVAATGRLSSSDPNLQNIPIRTEEGRRIRAAFVAAPGKRLISADYSQIELRVLAHLSEDGALVDAFQRGEDIHARTAADVFGALPTAEGRRLAKVINYGILYGMGATRAARELGVPQARAEEYIRDYFARFTGVRAYVDRTIAAARAQGYVTTIFGRRRYLPELHARDHAVRTFAERAATNTPIQGSAADLIKLAMLEVHRRLARAGTGARLLLQVHDELVVEAPETTLEATAASVRSAMEGVFPLRVPLRVDVHTGTNWAEAH
jgi:DNA polymerase-1